MKRVELRRLIAGAISVIMVTTNMGDLAAITYAAQEDTAVVAEDEASPEETEAVDAFAAGEEVQSEEASLTTAQSDEAVTADEVKASEAEVGAESDEAVQTPADTEDDADFETVTEEETASVAQAEDEVAASEADVNGEYTDGTFIYADEEKTVIKELVSRMDSSIVIPEGVVTIQAGAFSKRTGSTYEDERKALVSVDFSNAKNLKYIYSKAFSNNENLTTVNGLGQCSNLTVIGSECFLNCKTLDGVVLPVESTALNIEASAFSGCKALTSITLPTGLSTLGSGAFAGCSALSEVVVNTNSLKLAEKQTTFGGGALETVTFGDDVSKVPAWLFYSTKFAFSADDPEKYEPKVILGKNIDEVEKGAFMNAENLVAVYGKDSKLEKVGQSAFEGNKTVVSNGKTTRRGIEVMELPDTFSVAGDRAFFECNVMPEINTSGLTYIGQEAFAGCAVLDNINIPDTVKNSDLGKAAFANCYSLSALTIPQSYTVLPDSVFKNCALVDYTLFDKIETMGSYALAGNAFGEVHMTDALKSCGTGCFSECLITDLVIGNNLEYLPSEMFKKVVFLKSATIPSNIHDIIGDDGKLKNAGIGSSAFFDCYNLEDVTIESRTKAITIGESAFSCDQNKDTGKYQTSLASVVFKDGSGVEEIGNKAFCNCVLLVTADLPDSITTIGQSAFENCTAYTGNIVIPEKVKKIGKNAFYSCGSAKKVIVKSVVIEECGADIFAGCTIEGVELAEGLTSIPNNMFYEAGYKENTEVVIPKTVETVGDNAFSGSDKVNCRLVKVTFEEGSKVRKIGKYAFAYSANLAAVNFPSTLEEIGEGAFFGDKVLGESAENGVDLPAGIRRIGTKAFSGCIKLSHLYIPSTVIQSEIGEKAFDEIGATAFRTGKDTGAYEYLKASGQLNEDTVSQGVNYITYKYDDDVDVEEVQNDSANSDCYESEHKVMTLNAAVYPGYEFKGWFLADGNGNATATEVTSTEGMTGDFTVVGKFSIKAPVEEMFVWDTDSDGKETIITGLNTEKSEYKDTSWIIIPKKCKTIRKEAFKGNANLSSLAFEEGCELQMIGDSAFQGCTKLRVLNFTNCNRLNSIGKYAFDGCVKLKKVTFNKGLNIIQNNAFQNCIELPSVVFEDGMETIGAYAFNGCTMLSTVTINASGLSVEKSTTTEKIKAGGKEVTVQLKGFVFNGCNIRDIKLGYGEGGVKVTRIPAGLFYGATFAPGTTIVFDPAVNSVEEAAFALAENLVGIDFSNVTGEVVIKDAAFAGNYLDLKTAILPAKLKTIGDQAFALNFVLDNVTLPEELEEIGEEAFWGCLSFTKVVIPSKVDRLGIKAFKECALLESAEFKTDVLENIPESCFESDEQLKAVTYKDTLSTIDKAAFKKCTALENFSFEAGLTAIGESAFEECTALKAADMSQTAITAIGDKAFYKDTALATVKFPATLETIGKSAFDGCTAIGELAFGEALTEIGERAFADATSLGKVDLTACAALTKIGNSAFSGCEKLAELDLSGLQALTSIGSSAFEGCALIRTLVIPEAVTSIGTSAFKGIEKLKELTVNARALATCGSVASPAFEGCEGLTSFTLGEEVTIVPAALLHKANFNNQQDGDYPIRIPASVEKIGEMAFAGYTVKNSDTGFEDVTYLNITSVDFVEGTKLKEIGKSAFRYSFIENIVLPSSVTTLGEYAFADMRRLKKVILSEAITALPGYCFLNDPKLESVVTTGSKLKTIGGSAFAMCDSLREYYIPSSVQAVGTDAFKSCGNLEVLMIPNTVTKVDKGAFDGDTKLKIIISEASPIYSTIVEMAEKAKIQVSSEGFATISYELNGGAWKDKNSVPSVYYEEGDAVVFPEPTLKDHKFGGWYTDENFTDSAKITSTSGKKGPIQLYAKWDFDWSQIKYTVTYDIKTNNLTGLSIANEELAKNPKVTVSGNSKIKLPGKEDMAIDGAEFLGWRTTRTESEEGSKLYEPGATVSELTVKNGANVVLYAVWNGAFKYTITYDIATWNRSGKKIANEELAQTPKVNVIGSSKVKLPTAEDMAIEGYTFEGWRTKKTAEEEGATMLKPGQEVSGLGTKNGENIVLYAIWKGASKKIAYELIDECSNALANPEEYEVGVGVKLSPATTTLKGGKFSGWYAFVGDKFAKVDSITAKMTEDIKLYGFFSFDKNNYTVKLDMNEGKANGIPTSISAHKKKGFFLPMKDAVTREGYTFKGWSKKKNGSADYKVGEDHFTYVKKNISSKSDDEDDSSSDVTLYAVWNSFEYNSDVPMYSVSQNTVDGQVVYEFVEDPKDPTIGGGFYTEKQWTKTVVTKKSTHSADKKLKLLKPKKAGYTFKEWIISDALTGKEIKRDKSGVPKGIAGDIFVTPTWTENTYSIIWFGNGGTINGGKSYKDTTVRKYTDLVTMLDGKEVTGGAGAVVGWSANKKATSSAEKVVSGNAAVAGAMVPAGESARNLTSLDPKKKLPFKKKGKLKLYAIWN